MRIVAGRLAANKLSREQMDGRTYAVAPAVLVRAGVLNGQLLDLEELQAFPAAWNGRPVSLYHPQNEHGAFISANEPQVLEATQLGMVFNAALDGDRLLGELWLDVEKIRRIGGKALSVLERLERGELVELSTAYFHDIEDEAGERGGVAYNGIQRNLRPDHVALLPDQEGACSVTDGCGAPRTNAQGAPSCNCGCSGPATNATVMDVPTGVMIAFFPDEATARRLALDPTRLPDGVETIGARDLHLTVCYLGKIEEIRDIWSEESLLRELADAVEGEMLLSGIVNGMGRFTSEPGELEPIFYNFDSPALTNFRMRLMERMGWMMPRPTHGYTPHITVAYAPAGVDPQIPMPARETITFDAISLAWGGNVTNISLRGERRTFGAVNTGDQETMKTSTTEANGARVTANEQAAAQAAEETVTEETTEQAAAPAVDMEKLGQVAANAAAAAVANLFKGVGGVEKFVGMVQSLATNADRERQIRIARLAANAAVPYGVEQLAAMTEETLAVIETMAAPAMADYSGLFAPTLAANAGEEWVPYEDPK